MLLRNVREFDGNSRTLMPGVIENPGRNFLVILKDGKVYKNTLPR